MQTSKKEAFFESAQKSLISDKRLNIILILAALIMILNVILLFKYTGFTTESSAQGTISLYISGEPSCGDGSCNGNETCSSCSADCGACPAAAVAAAGGGGGTAVKKDFSVDKEIIKVMTRQEESFKTSITITNTEKTSQSFKLEISPSLKGLVFFSEESFVLAGGEEKTIDLTFVSTSDTIPSVYTGNLKIFTPFQAKKIPIVHSVKSKMILFDISLDIPARYKEVFPGEEVLLQVTIFNLGDVGKTDVSIEYIIKDFEGGTIIEQSEIVAVETQVSFSRMIKLPTKIKPGDYVAIAQVRYDASLGSSSVMFHVLEREKPFIILVSNKYFIIVLILIILAILFIIFLEYERKKMRDILKIQTREIRGINERVRKKKKIVVGEAVGIKNKIDKQLGALEKAYEAGYITKDSYEKGKKRLQNLKSKIKEKYL